MPSNHLLRRTIAFLAAVLLGALAGCQSTQPAPGSHAGGASSGNAAVDRMADSDTARAERAIERNQRDMQGERRPRDANRDRVVDQPRMERR